MRLLSGGLLGGRSGTHEMSKSGRFRVESTRVCRKGSHESRRFASTIEGSGEIRRESQFRKGFRSRRRRSRSLLLLTVVDLVWRRRALSEHDCRRGNDQFRMRSHHRILIVIIERIIPHVRVGIIRSTRRRRRTDLVRHQIRGSHQDWRFGADRKDVAAERSDACAFSRSYERLRRLRTTGIRFHFDFHVVIVGGRVPLGTAEPEILEIVGSEGSPSLKQAARSDQSRRAAGCRCTRIKKPHQLAFLALVRSNATYQL